MFISVKNNSFDGTDVRLLKFLAQKFSFVPNITVPDTYFASVGLVGINNPTLFMRALSMSMLIEQLSRFLDNPLYAFFDLLSEMYLHCIVPYINGQISVCFSPAREM